jgi:hypothetical protein
MQSATFSKNKFGAAKIAKFQFSKFSPLLFFATICKKIAFLNHKPYKIVSSVGTGTPPAFSKTAFPGRPSKT